MTTAWMFLIIAGLFEVVWAVGLKYTQGFTRLVPTVLTLTAMVANMVLLSRAIQKIPVGTGYAVWTGVGAVGTAVVGVIVLGEPRTVWRLISIGLIVAGIIGLKLASGPSIAT